MLGLSFLKARGRPCFYPEAQHSTFFLSGTLEPDPHSCPLPEPTASVLPLLSHPLLVHPISWLGRGHLWGWGWTLGAPSADFLGTGRAFGERAGQV